MASDKPRSLIDSAVQACLSLLVGAVALYAAVRLVEAVWSTLLAIAGGALLVAVLAAAWRARSRRW